MVREDSLSAVLTDFARTLLTDFPIQAILDHLVERIVDVLPITSAGVTLISASAAPHYIAASNEEALRFEKLQSRIGQGPCISAYESGRSVTVPDLATDDRYPLFGPAAVEAGLRAVFTFPLRHGEGRVGALDLYREEPGALDPHDLDVAQTLADVATAYLLNAWARDAARETSDAFRHSAMHDPLTGLPNRLLLQERLEHAAQRAERSRTYAAILFVDLDRFKAVNDTHGHQVGDELLFAVAKRLSGLVRTGDTLARVSGDEFVFLCEELSSPVDVEVLARRVDESFGHPFAVAGIELVVTASVGVAFAGAGGDISNELLAKADLAMYQAKRRGGSGHRVVDLRSVGPTGHPGSLEADLWVALADDRLDLAYQPIVRSGDGLVIGVEALLRWTHPSRGVVSPSAMVQVAEHSDLILAIGRWVLERSCRERTRWLDADPGVRLDLAVNVSPRQLVSPNFATTVADILSRTGMDPAALVLEMTESIFIEDTPRALAVLSDLRGLGIRLALDDFGTGFSSLSYLRRMPIDIVKIDQGFVADIDDSPAGGAIVAAVTNLAHVLGLTVVAEGVQTQHQHDAIAAVGCDLAQGFFYAQPMSGDEVQTLLAQPDARPTRLPLLHVTSAG